MPITWRNVSGGGGGQGAAVNMFDSAQRSTNAGFNKISDLLSGLEQRGEANWNQTKDNNTNAFKDMLAGAKSVDELAALEASGQLSAGNFGAQIDQDVLRDGADNRKDYLRDVFVKQQEFENTERIAKDAPFLDSLKTSVAGMDFTKAGNVEQAKALISEAIANGMSEKSGLEALEYLTGEDRGDKTFDINMQKGKASIAASQSSTAYNSQRMNQDRTLFGQSQEAYRDNKAAKERLEFGADIGHAIGTEIGSMFVGDAQVDPDMVQQGLGEFQNRLKQAEQDRGIKFKPAEYQALQEQFLNSMRSAQSPSAEDSQQFQAAIAPLTEAHEAKIKYMEDEYQKETENNPFYMPESVNPEVTAQELVNKTNVNNGIFGGDGGWNANEKTSLMREGADVLANGIDIKGDDGTSEHYQVTPGMLQYALTHVNEHWRGKGGKNEGLQMKAALRDLVSAEGFRERYERANNSHDRFLQRKDAMNTEYLKGIQNIRSNLNRTPTFK